MIKMEQLVFEVSHTDPWIPSETDGCLSCFYCRTWKHHDQHSTSCIWVRAKQLMGEKS